MQAACSEPTEPFEDEREKRKLVQYNRIIEKQKRKAILREKMKPENVKKAKYERIREAMDAPVLDRENLPEPPVFYPTVEEMSDPIEYIESLCEVGKKCGIVKIVMPENYRLPDEEIRSPKLREDFTFKPRVQILGTAGDGFKYGNEVKLGAYCEEAAEHYKNYINSETDPEGKIDEVMTERVFWSTLKQKTKATVKYGVDVDSTVVMHDGDRMKDWAMDNFGMNDGTALKYVGYDMPGVTTPFYYIGMLFSMFCWHNEDNYLYSISMLHAGATKTWYGVPGECADSFVEKTRHLCRAEVFHKCQMIHPEKVKKAGVPIYRTHQRPGEAVITFPGAFHAGFSHGFTVAEAVNFGLFNWLKENRRSVVDYRTKLGGRKYPIICHEQFMLRILEAISAGSVKNASHLQEALSEAVVVFREISRLEGQLESLVASGAVKTYFGASEECRRALLQASGPNQDLQCAHCGNTCFAGTVRCVNGIAAKCRLYRTSRSICLACFVDGPTLCSCPEHVFGPIYGSAFFKSKLLEILESGALVDDELATYVRDQLADRDCSQATAERSPSITNGESVSSSDPKADLATCNDRIKVEDMAEPKENEPDMNGCATSTAEAKAASPRATTGTERSVEGEAMIGCEDQNLHEGKTTLDVGPQIAGEESVEYTDEATGCNIVKENHRDSRLPASLAAIGCLYGGDEDSDEGMASAEGEPICDDQVHESVERQAPVNAGSHVSGEAGLRDVHENMGPKDCFNMAVKGARSMPVLDVDSDGDLGDLHLHLGDNVELEGEGRVRDIVEIEEGCENMIDERQKKSSGRKKEKNTAKALSGDRKRKATVTGIVKKRKVKEGVQTPYDGIEVKYPVYERLREAHERICGLHNDVKKDKYFIPQCKHIRDWNKPEFLCTLRDVVDGCANMLKNVLVAEQWSRDMGTTCRTATIETCETNGQKIISIAEGLISLRQEGKGLLIAKSTNDLRELNRTAAGLGQRLEQIKKVVTDKNMNGESAVKVLGLKSQTAMNFAPKQRRRNASNEKGSDNVDYSSATGVLPVE